MKLFHRSAVRKKRVIFLRRRYLAIPGALLCICALCLLTNLPSYVATAAPERQLPIYCVQKDCKTCALTFDAAWGDAILRHRRKPPEPMFRGLLLQLHIQ